MSKGSNAVKHNIIFIGMSGSGKSTVSMHLAKHSGYELVDTDKLIELYCGGTDLQKIVDRYKSDYQNFLELERKVAIQHFAKNSRSGCAIATGGSFCYSGEALKTLPGTVYYLHISWNGLGKRILDFGNRGFICFKKTLKAEYYHRIGLYKNLAHVTIDCDNKSIAEVASAVIESETMRRKKLYEEL